MISLLFDLFFLVLWFNFSIIRLSLSKKYGNLLNCQVRTVEIDLASHFASAFFFHAIRSLTRLASYQTYEFIHFHFPRHRCFRYLRIHCVLFKNLESHEKNR